MVENFFKLLSILSSFLFYISLANNLFFSLFNLTLIFKLLLVIIFLRLLTDQSVIDIDHGLLNFFLIILIFFVDLGFLFRYFLLFFLFLLLEG